MSFFELHIWYMCIFKVYLFLLFNKCLDLGGLYFIKTPSVGMQHRAATLKLLNDTLLCVGGLK